MTLYEVSAYLRGHCDDGRDFSGAWGNEKQFHATRESAEAACQRLRNGGYWGCPEPPTYEVMELTRDHYPEDSFGDQEWRAACRQAGVDPATGRILAHA